FRSVRWKAARARPPLRDRTAASASSAAPLNANSTHLRTTVNGIANGYRLHYSSNVSGRHGPARLPRAAANRINVVPYNLRANRIQDHEQTPLFPFRCARVRRRPPNIAERLGHRRADRRRVAVAGAGGPRRAGTGRQGAEPV